MTLSTLRFLRLRSQPTLHSFKCLFGSSALDGGGFDGLGVLFALEGEVVDGGDLFSEHFALF
jgi:hypothetical protein